MDKKDIKSSLVHASLALQNMLREMLLKNLETKRLSKVAVLLDKCAFKNPAVFHRLRNKCLEGQHNDGGFAAIVDTMWNISFLKTYSDDLSLKCVNKGMDYLEKNTVNGDIWGRGSRDFARVPVTGTMLYLFPELRTEKRLSSLIKLWKSEFGSLTYKASYFLLAITGTKMGEKEASLLNETAEWLASNQRNDGSFGPWKEHPVQSDVYCTSVAILGMLTRPQRYFTNIENAVHWMLKTQLDSGIWPYHEIEDGASWAILALSEFLRHTIP